MSTTDKTQLQESANRSGSSHEMTLADFTSKELTELGQTAWAKKKAHMHEQGVPTTKVVNNKLYYEHPDGTLEFVKELS